MANNTKRYDLAIEKGNILVEQKKYREAVGAFKVALSEFKDRPEVYAGLGDACIGQKQYSRALDCYKLASRLSKGNADYLTMVADLQERQGLLNDAAKTYMAIGERQYRGGAGDVGAAIGHWERAIRLDPNLLGAHQRLALSFHKEGNIRKTVREYLALARILSMRGENPKALQICRTAQRLDPDNEDIVAAIRLIQMGEEAYPELEEDMDLVAEVETPADEEGNEGAQMVDAVRQIATAFEEERSGWNLAPQNAGVDLVAAARKLAQEELATELFREEEGSGAGDVMLKLERDALIGQALDFQSRGDVPKAISCFEKAIKGGLDLPGAYFLLGLLYIDNDSEMAAFQVLEQAGQNERYTGAVRDLLSR